MGAAENKGSSTVRPSVRARAGGKDGGAWPDLVFAFIGPIGVALDKVEEAFEAALSDVGYVPTLIRLMDDLMAADPSLPRPKGTSLADQYSGKMSAGTAFRKKAKNAAALASFAVSQIVAIRSELIHSEPAARAYLIHQLKTTDEVNLLRSIYGPNCVVVSAYAPRDNRSRVLAQKIADSEHSAKIEDHEPEALDLILRDRAEGVPMGQAVGSAYHRADVFIDASDEKKIERQVERCIQILFQHPVRTPTNSESSMFQAYGASLRSADAGKQVGAAIAAPSGNTLALGYNEVPCAGGGHYGADDAEAVDWRDYKRPEDPNRQTVRGILGDLLRRMSTAGWLKGKRRKMSAEELVLEAEQELILREDWQLGNEVDPRQRGRAQLYDIIEFYRAVHAEMSALMAAARRGVSVEGATMYVTAFPCHECAKHIVAAGLKEVVFVEPYPKSRVAEMFSDSIVVDPDHDDPRVVFRPFIGVAPRRYAEWFTMPERKVESQWIRWSRIRLQAQPRGAVPAISYVAREKDELDFLSKSVPELMTDSPSESNEDNHAT